MKTIPTSDLVSAIDQSVAQNKIVKIVLPGEDFDEEVFALFGEIGRITRIVDDCDSSTEQDGSESVWGTTDAGESFRISALSGVRPH